MKYDIILAGVGGQGVLTLAAVIAEASIAAGYNVRQSEVHGMAQRGGAVLSHLRISDETIYSDLVPKGAADMVLSMEPMESLRYLDFLGEKGVVVSAAEAVENIPDYPSLDGIHQEVKNYPRSEIIEITRLAREAGSVKAGNMVLIGAASKYLPLEYDFIKKAVSSRFASKGEDVIGLNFRALDLGRG